MLEPLELLDRAGISHVAGVQRRAGLDQDDPSLTLGDGTMLHPVRDDGEFSFVQPHVSVAQLDSEPALDYQEELVLDLVLMPDELTLELDQLDEGVVYLAD